MLALIADPDKSARTHAAEALRRAGFSTLEAESGEEAVALTRRELPRVVVLEVSLPGICGFAERATPGDSGVASGLTAREREVFALLAQGLDQDEIAGSLFISPKTVGTHIEHILGKLGVRSRAQAVALAYRRNLIDTKPLHSLGITALLLSKDGFLLDWLGFWGTASLSA